MTSGPAALIHPYPNASSPPPLLATPTHKQWYDKLAEALLGDDDDAPRSSQFRCVKCDRLNASVRSKREARRSVSLSAASSFAASSPAASPHQSSSD
ncbi:hypothetical protein PC9H_009124 [Pleurotus ostreatus]|uniref:Uncharacterized protein n=1 Tax=Pleurotus ostreatus TaxID=5322 RepID=A0A8H6ZQ44_PLEOS|nr:uncharacterized protein PC9H_009124 [Pleurotus ostreatus]KAF7426755.1 hypothetical protein PC9H_009124 [Pleurotus ostreatus]